MPRQTGPADVAPHRFAEIPTVRRLMALLLAALFCAAWTLALAGEARAQGRQINLIQDAEIEAFLKELSRPIFLAADLDPNAIRILIVNDQSINAFVAGGQNMFINTGLITTVDTPNELEGVIAHETGHITGGHLTRTRDAISDATTPALIGTLLGIGALAMGAGDVGMALITGGQTYAQRSFLAYSRGQESAADQAGATFLEKAELPPDGMLRMFERFRDQEILSAAQQDEFARSHPVSQQRLSAMSERASQSPYYGTESSPEKVEELKMVQAKIHGFMESPSVTFRRYPPSDTSDPAHYARAIAYSQQALVEQAFEELKPVRQHQPDNPYVVELAGQMLFEAGKVKPSVDAYEKAVSMRPTSSHFRLGLGRALLALEEPEAARKAAKELEMASQLDPTNPYIYYHLAIAYARVDNQPMAQLATAERYYYSGALPQAKSHASRAIQGLREGSPQWLRAQDILSEKIKRG